jgi:hypothetical protein
MLHEAFAGKIAYACAFARSMEEASQNLVRLIVNGQCGFDEGSAAWQATVSEYLASPDELLELNRFGATFTAGQWRVVLEYVRDRLIGTGTEPEPGAALDRRDR